mgnify:CR=1 FL=1
MQNQIPTDLIKFTDAAARKVMELIMEEHNPELKLRVYISGGGCSGFQYGFTFDEDSSDDDLAEAEDSSDDELAEDSSDDELAENNWDDELAQELQNTDGTQLAESKFYSAMVAWGA